MAKFKWHADYFDDVTSGRCVRRAIIEADNACHAEKSVKAQMGLSARVEVWRVATTSPSGQFMPTKSGAEKCCRQRIASLSEGQRHRLRSLAEKSRL
jgi:hypothetical protein